jgi:hypothetical protein
LNERFDRSLYNTRENECTRRKKNVFRLMRSCAKCEVGFPLLLFVSFVHLWVEKKRRYAYVRYILLLLLLLIIIIIIIEMIARVDDRMMKTKTRI